jgi:hypothetical protein
MLYRVISFLVFLSIIALIVFSAIYFYPIIHNTWFSNLLQSYEIFYVVGTALLTGFISLWFWISQKLLHKTETLETPKSSRAWGIILLLSAILIVAEGAFYFFTRVISNPQFAENMNELGVNVAVTNYLQIAATFFSLILLFFVMTGKIKNRKYLGWIFDLVVVGLIIFTTFFVDLSKESFYDQTSFAGPIFFELKGIPPLTYHTLFGFLGISFLTQIFRFIPITTMNLAVVTALIVTFGFIFMYFVLVFLLKSRLFAGFGICCIILGNHLVQSFDFRNMFLQTTFYRFGSWTIVMAFIMLNYKFRSGRISRIFPWIVTFVLSLATLWVLDTGIYLIASYLLFCWFIALMQNSFTRAIPVFLTEIFRLILSLSLTVGIVCTVFYLQYHTIPAIWKSLSLVSNYASLDTYYLMRPTVLPWIIMLTPFVTIIYLLVFKKKSDINPSTAGALWAASAAIPIFSYYIIKINLNVLHVVLVPALFCLLYITKETLEICRSINRLALLGGIILWAGLYSLPLSYNLTQGVIAIQNGNAISTLANIKNSPSSEQVWFAYTAAELTKRYPQYIKNNDFGIVSIYDAWYEILLGNPGKVGSNCLAQEVSHSDVSPLINNIIRDKPTYLFVSTEGRWKYDPPHIASEEIMDAVDSRYEKVDNIVDPNPNGVGDISIYRIKSGGDGLTIQ